MLTAGILDAFQKGVDRLATNKSVKTIARGS